MRKIVAVILFSFLLLPLIANAKSLTYTDEALHYSLTLPDHWDEIPQATIDEAMRNVAEANNQEFVTFDAGFQYGGYEYFTFPYILVSNWSADSEYFTGLAGYLEGGETSESAGQGSADRLELLAEAIEREPYVDKEKNVVIWNLPEEGSEGDKAAALLANFIGHDGVAEVIFYSLESEYSEYLPAFSQIIDSFEFQPGFGYGEAGVAVVEPEPTAAAEDASGAVAEEAAENEPPSLLEMVIGGVIVVGVIAGIVWLMLKPKKKAEEQSQPTPEDKTDKPAEPAP